MLQKATEWQQLFFSYHVRIKTKAVVILPQFPWTCQHPRFSVNAAPIICFDSTTEILLLAYQRFKHPLIFYLSLADRIQMARDLPILRDILRKTPVNSLISQNEIFHWNFDHKPLKLLFQFGSEFGRCFICSTAGSPGVIWAITTGTKTCMKKRMGKNTMKQDRKFMQIYITNKHRHIFLRCHVKVKMVNSNIRLWTQ